MRVIIVEHNTEWRNKLCGYVSEFGYEIISVHATIDEAIQGIYHSQPELIITNFLINQLKIIQLLKDPSLSHVPFLFISDAEAESYNYYNNYPNVNFLIKPFEKMTLQSILSLLCKGYTENAPLKNRNFIVKNTHNHKVAIDTNDILFIKVNRNYCSIKTHKLEFKIKKSLARIHTLLGDSFVRIHRDTLLNKKSLKYADINKLEINVFESKLPIGRVYKKNIIEMLNFFGTGFFCGFL